MSVVTQHDWSMIMYNWYIWYILRTLSCNLRHVWIVTFKKRQHWWRENTEIVDKSFLVEINEKEKNQSVVLRGRHDFCINYNLPRTAAVFSEITWTNSSGVMQMNNVLHTHIHMYTHTIDRGIRLAKDCIKKCSSLERNSNKLSSLSQ